MAEYRLTPAAVSDLENIWQYTAATWGIEQAERYTDDVTAACADIAQAPDRAPACDDIRPGYRRWGVGGMSSTSDRRATASRSCASCMGAWTRPVT